MSHDELPQALPARRRPAHAPLAVSTVGSSKTHPDALRRLVDPEWVLFQIFLLVPSLACALWGDSARAGFLARLALYIGFLKWLGWVVLTRPTPRPQSFLMFPLEMLVGLTLSVLWFYLRNVFGWLVPGSYSLVELGVAAWLVTISQVSGAIAVYGRSMRRQALHWPTLGRAVLIRGSVYLPFVLTLTLTLWSVSKEVFVPSQDGWFHSFIARVYLNDGIFYRHFNGDNAIFYTSGFGAINAVTAAVSGLTVVQANNLQHILWIVTGVWLVTATVAVLAQRLLAPLHFLPPLFLSAYPVHNLPPDLYWTHTPQQTASALLVAIPLLSLLLPVAGRMAFYLALALQAMLSLTVLALSPVCAFFLPVACGTALLVNSYRGRRSLREGLIKLCAVQAAFMLLAAMLVLPVDRFYSTVLLNPAAASYMKSSQFGGDGSTGGQVLAFSARRGLEAAAAVDVMAFIRQGPEDATKMLPGRFLPWLALALAVAACWFAARQQRTTVPAARHLAITAAVSLICWLGIKYWASFVSAGITSTSLDAHLLQVYVIFLARRLELWLLLVAVLTAAVGLHVAPRRGGERAAVAGILGSASVTLLIWWLPFTATHLDPRVNHLVPRNIGFAGRITYDDIELTRWMERNLSRGRGTIGITAMPFKLRDAKLLFPIGASQAPSLYGKQYNFCFQVFDPARHYGFDDYTEHIVNYFDADWCLKNDIRYFHVPLGDVYPNHGLARAREVGLLEPVRTVSSSGVYAVRSLPWKPLVVPGPARHESSHQVSWQPDGSGIAQGHDAQVVFEVHEPAFVHAIRFKYTLTNPTHSPAAAQLFWRNGDQVFVEHERTARLRLEAAPTEQTLTILVHDTLDSFRFDPDDKACTFRIREIELLVRPPERSVQPSGG
jgi:hypothetical protein